MLTQFCPDRETGRRVLVRLSICTCLIATNTLAAEVSPSLSVGFDAIEITPTVGADRPVWMAGYGWGRKATGVHDPLFARTVVLSDGRRKFALVSVDLVGLQFPEVEAIREHLPDFDHVLVGSTHNHEGPDTIGIWGRTPIHRGVDPLYLKRVVSRVVTSVRRADSKSVACRAQFGTAKDDSLLGDSRKPVAKDGVLRVLRFQAKADDSLVGILVQWNCHPEALGSRNTLITADFCYSTVQQLQQQYNCPIAYFSGAVGGLMAPPDHLFHDADGHELREGDYQYAEAYGQAVAGLASKAIERAESITLTPFEVNLAPIAIPVRNPLYRTARIVGVVRRRAVQWTGDFHDADSPPIPGHDQTYAVRSEVGVLRLGQLIAICVPGELYPELVYGGFQEPVEPNVDYPDASLEKPVDEIVSEDQRWMLFGLANDEIGYIIPRRQWDQQPPFAYGRSKAQYGEINSCGVDVAPIIMQAIEECVAKVAP